MQPEVWLDAEQGNDNIHYAVPNDYLVCSGISQLDPMDAVSYTHLTLPTR